MSSIPKSVSVAHPNRSRQHLQVLSEETPLGLIQSPALIPQPTTQTDIDTVTVQLIPHCPMATVCLPLESAIAPAPKKRSLYVVEDDTVATHAVMPSARPTLRYHFNGARTANKSFPLTLPEGCFLPDAQVAPLFPGTSLLVGFTLAWPGVSISLQHFDTIQLDGGVVMPWADFIACCLSSR